MTSALETMPDLGRRISGASIFDLTPTSLALTKTAVAPTMDELTEAGRTLGHSTSSVLWWIGDWMALAEKTYGSTYRQGEKITGLSYQTLANVAAVCRSVESSRRRENLQFSHHAEVAGLAPWQQEQWLERAEEEKLSQKRLRELIAGSRELPPADPRLDIQFRLAVVPERASRWRAAADLAGVEFSEWAAGVLDRAAA